MNMSKSMSMNVATRRIKRRSSVAESEERTSRQALRPFAEEPNRWNGQTRKGHNAT